MKINIIRDLHPALAVDDILLGQGGDPSIIRKRKPLLINAAERAIKEGLELLHPLALTNEVLVREHRHERIILEEGNELTGTLVGRQFAGAQRIVAAICTIGPELEAAATKYIKDDPLLSLALDGMGNASVEILSQQVCAYIGQQVQNESLQASTPISPGNPGWSVEIGQPQIFSLLDPSQIGVSLTSGGMMLPQKSISFAVGIGREMSQTNMCEICNMKVTCRYVHE